MVTNRQIAKQKCEFEISSKSSEKKTEKSIERKKCPQRGNELQ